MDDIVNGSEKASLIVVLIALAYVHNIMLIVFVAVNEG